MKRLEVLVKGKVQGVNFRRHVKSLAEAKGLKGQVRNLPDGDVEFIVEGDKADLLNLIEEIRVASPPIRVEYMDILWSDATDGFSDFSIVR